MRTSEKLSASRCASWRTQPPFFLAFVGYQKAFSPIAELAGHGAWTVHLPELLGRLVGWSEIVCAIALAAPVLWARAVPARRIACLYFILNQLAAAATHALHGEAAALPQNVVLIALCLFILWSDRRSAFSSQGD